MNFDHECSKGMSEAVGHETVLKVETSAKASATIQDSPHDSETQYGRSRAESQEKFTESFCGDGKSLPIPADNR